MKKVIIRKPGCVDVLELVEETDPEPRRGEVLVRTHAMTIGWPDVLIRTGVYKWMPPLPVTLGNELSGVVQEVGSGVTSLKVGDHVYISSRELNFQSGCYTTLRAVPAEAVIKLQREIDLDQALGLGYFSLAWTMLHDAVGRIMPRSVLIIGAAGGVGSSLAQLARQEGLTVIGTVSSPEKGEFARSLGAHHTIDYKTQSVVEAVKDLTHGEGVDLVFDHIVGSQFSDHFKVLKRWGTIVAYNAMGGAPGPSFFQDWAAHAASCIGIRYLSMHVYEGDQEGRRRILQKPLEYLADKRIRTPIGAVVPMAEVARAHTMLESASVLGRIILKP